MRLNRLPVAGPYETVESRCAGPGIENHVRAALYPALREPPSEQPHARRLLARCQGDPEKLTAKMIAEAAAEGNELAAGAMSGTCLTLGWAIAQMITLLAVEAVIVGGGVSLAGEAIFFEPLRGFVHTYVFPPLRDSYEILAPLLGEEVVVHGAVAMAADRYSKSAI
jgi:glucokinase